MEQQDLNRALQARIPEQGWLSSIPIVAGDPEEETLYLLATGTLLRVADESFLITAGHVAISAEEYDTPLCVPTPAGFVQLHGTWTVSAEGQYGTPSDPFDIAGLHLESKVVDKLPASSFLRLADVVSSDEDLSNGIFGLFGYPERMARESTRVDTDLVATPFQFITYAYDGRTDLIRGYQERLHLLLSADPSELTDVAGQPLDLAENGRNIKSFPHDLAGISGSAIWRIARRDIPVEQWREERAKVAGITIETREHHGSKIIFATKWIAVSTLLITAFPELKPAFELLRYD